MMYALSLVCSPYQEKSLLELQPTIKMVLDLTLLRVVFGEGAMRELILMLEFLTLMPLQTETSLPSCYRKHEQIKKGCMNKDAEKWNMLPLNHW